MAEPVDFVYDGDTIYDGPQGYRSAGVNTTEMKVAGQDSPQAGAEAAQQRWEQLLSENPDVSRKVVGTDPYGRKITEFVTPDGVSLNEQMVREGYAVPFMNEAGDKYDFAQLDYMRNLSGTGQTPLEGGTLITPKRAPLETGILPEFGEGLSRGAEQTGAMFAAAFKAASQALGMDNIAYNMQQLQDKYTEKANEHAPAVGTYKDVEDWKSGLMYVSGMLGENTPQFGVDLAIGAATGGVGLATAPLRRGIAIAALKRAEGSIISPVVSKAFSKSATQALARNVFGKYANRGMFGSQYAQAVGDAQTELEQNGVTDGQLTALAAGLAPAGLDYATTKALLRTASRAAKQGNFSRASEIITEGVKQTGLQGANEALSELVNKSAVLYHVDGFDVFDDNNIEDMINATLGGMLFGSAPAGMIGGAAFARNKIANRLSDKEIEQQNAELIGATEDQSSIIDSGEDAVNVSTQTTDGGYVEETARASEADAIKDKQKQAAESAGNEVAAQIVRTPEDTIADRTFVRGSYGFNADQVLQPKAEILAELKSVKNRSKNVALISEAQMAELRTEPDAFAGLYVTTTDDGRAAVYRPDHQQRVERSLQKSDPKTFRGDGFFTRDLYQIRSTLEKTNENQQVDEVLHENPVAQVQDTQENQPVNEQASTQEPEITQDSTRNLTADEGNAPQDFTQTRDEKQIPFESGVQQSLPFGDASERGGIVKQDASVAENVQDFSKQVPIDFAFAYDDVIAQADAERAQKKAETTKKANRRREGADEDTARPTGKRTKEVKSEYDSEDFDSESVAGVSERDSIDGDAIGTAIKSSENHQKSRRELYATQAAENNRAGAIRKELEADKKHLADLQTRIKNAEGSQATLLRKAFEATKESIAEGERELAYINASQKGRKGQPKKTEFEDNPNTVKFAKNGDPKQGIREVFMPDVVAKVIESNDPLYQSVSDGNIQDRYSDIVSDVVAYMAEQGYKVGDMEGKPLAYKGDGGFYDSKNLRSKAQRVSFLEKKNPTERDGADHNESIDNRDYIDDVDTTEGRAAGDRNLEVDDIRSTSDFATGDREIQASASTVSPNKKRKDKVEFSAAKGGVTLSETKQKYIKDLVERAGITSNINVVSGPIKGAHVAQVSGVGTLNPTLTIDAKKIRENYPSSSEDIFRLATAHELGHLYTRQELYDMPDSVAQNMFAEFEKAREKVKKSHTYWKGNGIGFDEFIADQFGLYLNGKSDINSSARSWFQKVAEGLMRLVNSVADIFGRTRLTPNENMFKLFDGMVRGTKRPANFYTNWMNEAFAVQSAPSRVRSYRNDADMRAVFEQRATGRGSFVTAAHNDKNVQAEIDRIRAKNKGEPDEYNLTVGDALSEVDSITKMAFANTKDFLTDRAKMRSALNSTWDFTTKALSPIFGTADGELRRMGGVGVKVANAYRDVFDNTSAMRAIWLARLENVVKKVDHEALANFAKGNGDLPVEVRKFLNSLHNQISDPEINPTIGWLEDYFPRMYDLEQIDTRRDEFVQMLVEEASKNGIAMSEAEARNITSSILSGDNMFTNYADMKMSLHGPSFQNGKLRELDFISDEVLRKQKFVQQDVIATLERYTANAIRQNEYLKKFGGWNTIESEVEFESRTGRKKEPSVDAFLYKMLMDFPLRKDNGKIMDSFEKSIAVVPSADMDFQHKNAKYIKQLLDKKFVRKNSNGKFEYFDRNKHLRRYGAMLQADSDAKFDRFSKIVDAYEGRLGADTLSPETRKLMSNVMAYQNATTMVLSGFSAIPDMAGVFFRSRDFGGMLEASREIYNLIATTKGKEKRALLSDLGFTEGQLANQAILESYGLQHMSGGAQKFNDKLFKYNGTRALTNMGRVMSAAMAERFIARNARRALDGDVRATRYLKELGLTPQEANHINRDGFKFYNHYVEAGLVGKRADNNAVVAEKIHKAMHAFVDSAMVRPNATQRPVWGSDPRWMLVWHLKSFMYSYGKVILGGLGREMRARWKESSGTKFDKLWDASIPAMVYAAPVLVTSALALALRQQVQYEMWGDDSPTDNMDWGQYLFEISKRGGVLGPLEMGYSFVDATTSNRSGIVQLLGPTASQLETILSFDAERIMARSVPVASQIPAVREWMLASMGFK